MKNMKKRICISAGILTIAIVCAAVLYHFRDEEPEPDPRWEIHFRQSSDLSDAIPGSCIQDIRQTAEQDGFSATLLQTIMYDQIVAILMEYTVPEEYASKKNFPIPRFEMYEGTPVWTDAGLEGESLHMGGFGSSSGMHDYETATGSYAASNFRAYPESVFHPDMTVSLAVTFTSGNTNKEELLSRPIVFTWKIQNVGTSMRMDLESGDLVGKVLLNPLVLDLKLYGLPGPSDTEIDVQLTDQEGEPLEYPFYMYLYGGTDWLNPPVDVREIRGIMIEGQEFLF